MNEFKTLGTIRAAAAGAVGGIVVAAVLAGISWQALHIKGQPVVKRFPLLGGSSILMVRGGSITALTNDSAAWQGAAAPFCAQVTDANYIYVDGNQVPNVALPWTIDIYGRLPSGGQRGGPSQQGIELQGAHQDCIATTHETGYSVTVTFFGTATFYPKDLPSGQVWKGNKRLLDNSPNCSSKATPDPATDVGDRDLCEYMGNANMFFPTPNQPTLPVNTTPTTQFTVAEDREIVLGAQQ